MMFPEELTRSHWGLNLLTFIKILLQFQMNYRCYIDRVIHVYLFHLP